MNQDIAAALRTPTPFGDRLAGWLLFLALLGAVASNLSDFPAVISGLCAWSAALLMWPKLKGQQRIQSMIMLALGTTGLLWAAQFQTLDWQTALSANRHLIAMLCAVTFLRLVATRELTCDQSHPTGVKALIRTLFGVHLFGSVINYSAPILMGERLSRGNPLQAAQAIVLSRGFGAAAFWSPFFIAMGVALTNSPGADLVTISMAGIPMALMALAMTRHELKNRNDLDAVEGYPMQTHALKIPAMLAVTILITHELLDQIPVVSLIASASLILTLVLLVKRNPRAVVRQFTGHIHNALSTMQSEVWLFLSAGVFATGINAVVQVTGFDLAVESVGALEISVFMLIGLALAILAIHPVIIIASAGSLLTPLAESPNLLALSFLMLWVMGVSASPFSGQNLSMASRFQLNNFDFLRWNMGYSLKLYLLCVAVLFSYEAFDLL
ncbi:MAG: hypothetical protein CMI09_16140 [Oceanospirillaceae bacterium]|nr:hypothetical protein [Oceanospirillaceae bacterium]